MLARTLAMSIATLVVVGSPALAQSDDVTPPPEKCRVVPDTGDQSRQRPSDVDPRTTQSLTDKLDSCDGVLKPPAVGDQELTQPPPDTGEMREIKPRDLPGQQAGQQ